MTSPNRLREVILVNNICLLEGNEQGRFQGKATRIEGAITSCANTTEVQLCIYDAGNA